MDPLGEVDEEAEDLSGGRSDMDPRGEVDAEDEVRRGGRSDADPLGEAALLGFGEFAVFLIHFSKSQLIPLPQ